MQDTWEPHWTLPTLPEAANVLQNGVNLPHPKGVSYFFLLTHPSPLKSTAATASKAIP